MQTRGVELRDRVKDSAIAGTAGYLGTSVMEQLMMKLYQLETEGQRRREDEARPGPPFVIAAKKTFGWLGIDLADEKAQKMGMALHYLLPISWVPVYMLLRRRTELSPIQAGLAMGGAMSLTVDEGLTPLLGFSAPDRAYPLATHIRGLFGHLAFGVVVATVVEGGWELLGRKPEPSRRGRLRRRLPRR